MTTNANNTSNHLPANIRALRKMCCLSQEELAHHLGLNRGNISSYENGSAEPKLCNLMKISSFFNLSMGDITMERITCKNHYEQLCNRFRKIDSNQIEYIEKLEEEIERYSKLIDSSVTCFHHFADQIKENNEKLHPHYLFHYEQMHKITLDLLNKHKELLTICKDKKNT